MFNMFFKMLRDQQLVKFRESPPVSDGKLAPVMPGTRQRKTSEEMSERSERAGAMCGPSGPCAARVRAYMIHVAYQIMTIFATSCDIYLHIIVQNTYDNTEYIWHMMMLIFIRMSNSYIDQC